MTKQFNEINFNHLPWEKNQMADALATLAAMFWVNSSDENLGPLCLNQKWNWWKAMVLWHPTVHQGSEIPEACVRKW